MTLGAVSSWGSGVWVRRVRAFHFQETRVVVPVWTPLTKLWKTEYTRKSEPCHRQFVKGCQDSQGAGTWHMSKAEGTVTWRRPRKMLLLSTTACLQDTEKMESDSSWRYPMKGWETVCISWNIGISDWVLGKACSWREWSNTSCWKMWGNLHPWRCSRPWTRPWEIWSD